MVLDKLNVLMVVEEEGTALLVYKYVLGVKEDGGIALLVCKYVLGVEEDGIPLFWFTNKY